MRNLKKILALVLALVMTFSVMVTANAFTDDESITDTYAVATEVLAGLKVFEGYEDGSFRPQGAITRAEVAAIIYRVVTGDVDDKQVGIYADYNKFTDVPATAWYAGYVNYCANAELIKGMGDGTFAPSANVTGYQALAMILRALGYDKMGEFTGAGWDIRTASAGKTLGITKNITAGTLGVAATREVVAEIIFQAIQVPTVSYTLLTGYAENDETLGDTFGLKYIDAGVLTANEYADLYSSYALAAGKSEIEGVTLNLSTDLTEIGLSYNVYYTGKTVLYIEDSGLNTAWENDGAATSSIAKKVTGMVPGGEYFVNFDNAYADFYRSDYRIEYVLEGLTYTGSFKNQAELDALMADAAEYFDIYGSDGEWNVVISGSTVTITENVSNVIPAEGVITAEDMACMKLIFTWADKENGNFELGEVYVGTKSGDDVSDELSWKQFVAEYLYTDDAALTGFEGVGNGNWLKVIDNDGDGYADYVFQTYFEMARVERLPKNGDLFLSWGEKFGEYDETLEIDADEYTTSADLTVGDVVLFTEIDGVTYVELAPSFTGKVSKYTYKTEILTIEGEDYEESDICEHTGYFNVIETAKKETNYVWFQDFFGYIRAYAIPAGEMGNDFVLLNDAYFEEARGGDIYAVMAYLNDEWADKDAADDAFISTGKNDGANNWGRLITWDKDAAAKTNLAIYTEDDGVLDLASAKAYAYNAKGEKSALVRDYVDLLNKDISSKQRTFEGVYTKAADDRAFDVDEGDVAEPVKVQTNNSTVVYYYSQKTQDVTIVTGYKNILACTEELFDIRAMYAVATNVDGDQNKDAYWVADAIVVETYYPVIATSFGLVLGYNQVSKNVKDFGELDVVAGGALDTLNVVDLAAYSDSEYNYNADAYGAIVTPYFYVASIVDETDSYLRPVDSKFAAKGIYVVTIDREIDLDDYVVLEDGSYLDYTEDTIIYDIDIERYYNAITTEDAYGDDLVLELGKTYIVVSDGKGGIAYAIVVDEDTDALHDLIVADALNP